jgi:hypothetical protein
LEHFRTGFHGLIAPIQVTGLVVYNKLFTLAASARLSQGDATSTKDLYIILKTNATIE